MNAAVATDIAGANSRSEASATTTKIIKIISCSNLSHPNEWHHNRNEEHE